MCLKVGDKANLTKIVSIKMKIQNKKKKKKFGSNINLTKPRIPNLTFDGRWNNAGLYILIFKCNLYKRTLYSSLHAKGTWTSRCNFFLYIIWKKENVNKREVNWQLSPTSSTPTLNLFSCFYRSSSLLLACDCFHLFTGGFFSFFALLHFTLSV